MAEITQTKDVVALLTQVTKVIASTLEDGKFDIADLATLTVLFPAVIPAIQGITEVPSEVSDLSSPEILEISDLIVDCLGEVAGDRYEYVGEQLTNATLSIIRAIKAVKDETFDATTES